MLRDRSTLCNLQWSYGKDGGHLSVQDVQGDPPRPEAVPGKNHRTREGLNTVLPPTEQEPKSNLDCEWLLLSSGGFYDTTTGQVLKKQLVQEARATELGWMDSKNVWTKVPVR